MVAACFLHSTRICRVGRRLKGDRELFVSVNAGSERLPAGRGPQHPFGLGHAIGIGGCGFRTDQSTLSVLAGGEDDSLPGQGSAPPVYDPDDD